MFDSAVGPARLNAVQLAAAITDNQSALRAAECRVLELACAWADVHTRYDGVGPGDWSPLVERARYFGGDGTPALDEFCVAELGALHGVSTTSAELLLADALDLRHRLPRLWRQVLAGDVRAWQARKVAELTRRLSWDACADLDTQISGIIGLLPWGRFQKVLNAAILEADPELAAERRERARELRDVWATDTADGLRTIVAHAAAGDTTWFMATINRLAEALHAEGDADPVALRRSKAVGVLARPAEALQLLAEHRDQPVDQGEASEPVEPSDDGEPGEDDQHTSLNVDPPTAAQLRAGKPKVTLVFHLADAALRRRYGVARLEGGDMLTLSELHDWLADTGCPVTVKPVLDPADAAPIDAYEIPQWMRDAVKLRNLADVFPYGSCTTATMDLDHSIPWVPLERGGPPGQTRPGNLGPFVRSHHRVVTHGRWQRRQPDPGTFLFKTPTGRIYLVTNQGTLPLGSTDYAHAVWRAANRVDTEEEAA